MASVPSPSDPDTYNGALITLTTKSEIRYEGFVYNINTEESSIGLRDVRSYGTEGRKKDGQQVPPSNRVYEYILFRGSDIKDLQVKSLSPVQNALPIHDDPAIIKSQCNHPETISTSFPLVCGGYVAGPCSHTAQMVVPMSTFQGSIPLYHPGESSGTRGPPPLSNANSSGLSVPFQYPRPPSMSTSLTFAGSVPVADPSSLPVQMGVPRSTSQGDIPFYQAGESSRSWGAAPPPNLDGIILGMPPGESSRSWGAPPPNLDGCIFGMSPYWQGFYGPSSGSSHTQQQPLYQTSPVLSLPHSMHQSVYSSGNVPISNGFPYLPVSSGLAQNLPASSGLAPTKPATDMSAPNLPSTVHGTTPLQSPSGVGSLNISSSAPLLFPQPAASASDMVSSMACSVHPSTAPLSASLPLVSQSTRFQSDTNGITHPGVIPKTALLSLAHQTTPLPVASSMGTSRPSCSETPTPPLVTPGQLLPPGSTTLSSSVSSEPAKKVVQAISPKLLPSAPTTTQGPLLLLPSRADQKLNRPLPQSDHNHTSRGRGRGRGIVIPRPLTGFTEEFNFEAMNEKFNKDEVWGDLGKPNKIENKEDIQREDAGDVSEEVEKPVYVKDDFFDSLSSDAIDNGQGNGRIRYSEQMRRDTATFGDFPRQTFGDFPRYRGGRGGRWPGRGGRWPEHGGRTRGSYHGKGNDYFGRGRGRGGGRGK